VFRRRERALVSEVGAKMQNVERRWWPAGAIPVGPVVPISSVYTVGFAERDPSGVKPGNGQ